MRKTLFLVVTLASASIGLLAACGPMNPEAKPTPTPTPFPLGTRACPPSSTYTYENFGEPFLRSQCLGCHSADLPEGSRQQAPIDVNFNTYDEVRQWGVQIFADAADGATRMPPAGGPTAADRVALGDWLACNAPREGWADTTTNP